MKKFFTGLLFAMICLQANAMYITSFNYDLLLKPNKTETITNFAPWTVAGKCKLESDDEFITLDIAVTGKGTINGEEIQSGEQRTITAHNNDEFSLSAAAGAKLKITKVQSINQNTEQHVAIAHCHM